MSNLHAHPILESVMDCHGIYAFSHSPNRFSFKNNFVSYLGGPNEQFGTHKGVFKCECI